MNQIKIFRIFRIFQNCQIFYLLIVIINKTDLKTRLKLEKAKDFLKDKKTVRICAIKEKGISVLENIISGHILGEKGIAGAGRVMVTNLRHRDLFGKALDFTDTAIKNSKKSGCEELVAEDVRHALKFIGGVVGEVTADDILDRIFEGFCIGK